MEIRLRKFLIIAVVVLAAAGGGVFLAAPGTPRLPAAQPTPTGAPLTAAAVPTLPIAYVDESLGWDWQVHCAAQFQAFLARELAGQHITAVQVILLDKQPDRPLPFGTGYRAARVSGNCFAEQGAFTCQMAVTAGEPGADLDVAATLNAPYTLLDMHRARGANPDDIRRHWGLTTFQPLLIPAQEANQWHSACLQLSRVQ